MLASEIRPRKYPRPMIELPFEREHDYEIGELRELEKQLLSRRQLDPVMSNQWRCASGRYAKSIRLRNDELVPLAIFADQMKFSDQDVFRLMRTGDQNDAQIRTSVRVFNLQITLADLDWAHEGGGNPGYQHRLTMEALNKYGMVQGHGPFQRDGEHIVGPFDVCSSEERLGACQRGLVKALERKAHHDGRGCCLLIYARGYHIQTIDGEFEAVVRSAVSSCKRPNFDQIYVADRNDGWFVEA
jgi:hypothetical protein